MIIKKNLKPRILRPETQIPNPEAHNPQQLITILLPLIYIKFS